MNRKTINLIGYVVVLIGILLLGYGYLLKVSSILFLGILIVILGAFFIMIMQSISLFLNDKKLDIDALKKQGLTIVKCSNCEKENVLEDQYCIFCGELLGEENDKKI